MVLKDILAILTGGDKALLVTLSLLSCLSFFWLNIYSEPGDQVLITTANSEILRKSLFSDETFTVRGPVGDTTITIAAGRVRVVSSDCAGKICVHQGAISSSRRVIVCVPNQVTVSITGKRKDKFDAITG